jgi:uncharacterized protein YaaR (DUF327 family)
MRRLAEKWATIAMILAIIGVGSGGVTFLYDRFVPASFAEKTYATQEKLSTELSLTSSVMKEMQTEQRMDRLQDLMQQLLAVEKHLVKEPTNKTLLDYRDFLKSEIAKLQEKIKGK